MRYNKKVERNLSELLKQSLSGSQLALLQRVSGEATALGLPLYIVGGFVRDLVLGRAGTDFDLVVEGDAIALARALTEKYGGKFTAHTKFGTAKIDVREWRMENGKPSLGDSQSAHRHPISIDLISARSETYHHPAALPTVKIGTIEDDLRRRDFTINALAIRLDGSHFGELRDDLGGWDDLENGLIQVLHPQSFIDDPTRIYRAVRYEQRFEFRISSQTIALVPSARAWIRKLSPQRIRHELDLILEEPRAARTLARLAELELLEAIHSALPWDESIAVRWEAARRPDLVGGREDRRALGWMLWLMSLPEEHLQSLHKRLHFMAVLLKLLLAAARLFSNYAFLANWRPSQCVEYLDEFPLFAVYAVYLAVPEGPARLALEEYLAQWRHVRQKTTGKDLRRLGVQPGPEYRAILRELRDAWLDGELQNEQDEKKRLSKELSVRKIRIA